MVNIPKKIDNSKGDIAPGEAQEQEDKKPIQKIEAGLLKSKYAPFRFNDVHKRPEYQENGVFYPIDDFTLNSIVRDLKLRGHKSVSSQLVASLLCSEFAEKIHPVKQYFTQLPGKKKGAIKDLAKTVKLTDNTKHPLFEKSFTKWLVGVVANVFIEDRCANQLCFIIAGAQGTYKSTWIKNLCPPELSPYYTEGGVDPDNKDSILATTYNLIYNLDDNLAGVTAKKINELKGLLTRNTIKVRSPYGRYEEERKKIASFIGTSNEATFLHDPTGNRRFLAFEVKSIDIDAAHTIDNDAVWSEAYQLFIGGTFRYWLSKEEQDELAEYSAQFEVQTMEYETLTKYYEPSNPEKDMGTEMVTTTSILTRLRNLTGLRLGEKKMGEALRKAGFQMHWKKTAKGKRNRFWAVLRVEEEGGEKL